MILDRVATERLELLAATPALVRLECDDPAGFARVIDACLPDDWPPGLYDDDARRYMLDTYQTNPASVGWLVWYVVLQGGPGGGRSLVGAMGFLGPPDQDGQIVLGYSLSEPHRRKGYTTEAVGGLVRWAFAQGGVSRVVADTFPDLVGSVGVLNRCGFRRIGPGADEGTIRFVIDRPDGPTSRPESES